MPSLIETVFTSIGVPPAAPLSPADFPDLPTLRRAWEAHERTLRAFVASLDDAGLQRSVSYRSFAGVEGTSAMWEMLQHVVNHGTYHRGQVTMALRQLGATPPAVDFLVYYDQR